MKPGNFVFIMLISLLAALCLAGCASRLPEQEEEAAIEYIPYDSIPADYSLEDAKTDKCVVFENSSITSGQDVWEKFIERAGSTEPCMVRLAHYYTLENQNISAELYEEIKDDYPVIYFSDLSFDGESYTLSYNDGEYSYVRNYNYLKKYTGSPESNSAAYSEFTRWVLINDPLITWERIWQGMISSQSGDAVDCIIVYQDLR